MNETIKSILDRRSNRGFSAEQLTQEQIDILKECSLAAPTARNEQSWHFSFVMNRELILSIEQKVAEKIIESGDSDFAQRIRSRQMKVFYDAPLVVFISSDINNHWRHIDAGIAAENIAVAAQSLGLGSVIIGMCETAFEGEDGEKLGRIMDFPENHRFAIAVAVGKPTVSKDAHPIKENRLSVIE